VNDNWEECSEKSLQPDVHLYAVIRQSILNEKLDYIYPFEDGSCWRFSYHKGNHRPQISFIHKDGMFCGMNHYHEARKTEQMIPWTHTIESFMDIYKLEEQICSNLIYLWNNRK
jgi:hypothetical protein